VLNDQLNRTEL